MPNTSNASAQKTASVSKTSDEVVKDASDKTTEDKKTIEDGQDGDPTAQDTTAAKCPIYTAQNPMTLKSRKGNLFIDVEKANASKD